jgi:hypothetical protein
LAVQVGQLDDIAVDDSNSSHPSAGDILSSGTAETPGSDDEQPRVDQAKLS